MTTETCPDCGRLPILKAVSGDGCLAYAQRLRDKYPSPQANEECRGVTIARLRAELASARASEANHKEARQILANDLIALSHGGHVTTALGAAVEERIRAARELNEAERAVVDAAVAYYSSIDANDSPHVDRLEGNVAICANEGCLLDATDKLLALRAKKAGT